MNVVVVGGGPLGLAAASRLISAGVDTVVLEAGPAVGHTIRDWGHIRVFTDWDSVIDPVSREMLLSTGWKAPPPSEFPTGDELVAEYLEPLGALLAGHIRFEHRVVAISRRQRDKMRSGGRDAFPFIVKAETPDGPMTFTASHVIDASGTWLTPNPMGSDGLPADGETAATNVRYGIPDVLDAERSRYEGKRTLVVGAGHSAANALLDLAQLALESPGTVPIWAIRRSSPDKAYGQMEEDELPERGKVGLELRHRVDDGIIHLEQDFNVTSVAGDVVTGVDRSGLERSVHADEIVVATGQRPDLSITRELRLALDPVVEAPVALAPLIDPNIHSCLTVPEHGVDQLAHPEPGFFTVGIKSYGRAPTFLMSTGYLQLDSVVDHIING